MFKKISLLSLVAVFPSFVFAQDLVSFIDFIKDFLQDTVIYLIFSFAILFFLWNVFNYIRQPDKVKDSSKYIIWGIIALTVMFTIYGLIGIVAETFGLSFDGTVPQFRTGGN